jgi:hypothetical protein
MRECTTAGNTFAPENAPWQFLGVTMNKKQKIVLWAGIVVTVLMLTFLPTRDTVSVQTSQGEWTLRNIIRYRLIFSASAKDIKYLWLCLQCVVVWGMTWGLIAAFSSRPRQAYKKKEYSVMSPIDRIIDKWMRGK